VQTYLGEGTNDAHLLSSINDKRMGVIFLFCVESGEIDLDKKETGCINDLDR